MEAERIAGRLLIGRSPNRPKPAEFDSISQARLVWGLIKESLERYKGLRFAVDVAASLAPELSAGQLCHWEATLDLLHKDDLPVRTICMYDRSALSPAEIHGA